MSKKLDKLLEISSKIAEKRGKSSKSKSSRYTPKKGPSECENSFFKKIEKSQYVQEHEQEKQSYSNDIRIKVSSETKELKKKNVSSSQGSYKMVKESKKQQKVKRFNLPTMKKMNSKENLEIQFRNYLQYFEKIERIFNMQKQEIEKKLEEELFKLQEIKKKFINVFLSKIQEIKDKKLLQIIQNQNKSIEKEKCLRKTISNQIELPAQRQSFMERKNQRQSQNSNKKEKANSKEWANEQFTRMFSTLNQMKSRLHSCQNLKNGNKEKSKKSESKVNFVSTSKAKMKNKKSHE